MSLILKRKHIAEILYSTENLQKENSDSEIEFFFPTDCEHDYIYEVWLRKQKEDSNSSVISRVYKLEY